MVDRDALRKARAKVPKGEYHVDRDALRKARAKVPKGEYHVDRDALRKARAKVPKGEYHVDRDALRKARAKVPKGEYHSKHAKEIFFLHNVKEIKNARRQGYIFANEKFIDPDGREYELHYHTNCDGTNANAYCISNPWDSTNRSAGTDYFSSHIDNDGFLCLAENSCRATEESPYGLEYAILRARFWAVGFSSFMETGTFPNA
jgi:hypothetical protein